MGGRGAVRLRGVERPFACFAADLVPASRSGGSLGMLLLLVLLGVVYSFVRPGSVPDLHALAAGLEDRLEEVAVGVGVVDLAVADLHLVAAALVVEARLVGVAVAVGMAVAVVATVAPAVAVATGLCGGCCACDCDGCCC